MLTMASAFETLRKSINQVVRPTVRATWGLRAFGLTKVPLLLYCGPVVRALDEGQCIVEIPLTWEN